MPKPLAYNRDYALNAICPYFTMFPLEYPLRILRKHRHDNSTVVDPFCGRGTTIYAARRLSIPSHGMDISPIAVAIAQAKLSSATTEAVIGLGEKLIAKDAKQIPTSAFFRHAYSSSTLREICSLREALLRLPKETDESVLLRAAALGCLHGPMANDVTRAGYFSNQMPRTFASKPRYSVRYWRDNELKAPNVAVLDVIKRKLGAIPKLDKASVSSFQRIACTDARYSLGYKNLKGRLVVVTSPPYYGMKTYVQDQWLRNWFLGGPEEIDYDGDAQIRHSSHEDFARDLARVWTHLKKKADGIDLYVRFGTIPSTKSDAKKLFLSSLEESRHWKLISTRRADTASKGKRQADQMRGTSTAEDEFDFHAVCH